MAEKVGEPYEIIFLDWYMPEMDGAETAKAIHALNLKSQPHLVMVTAHGREEVLKEMEAAGLEDIFIKPVNASLLFDSVMRLLSDSQDYHIETIEETVDDYDLSSLINELKIIYGSSILVVEDNELNQEVALGLLSDEGFNVDIANDGKEAIYMINNKYYDIVLMDMQMPVMDGVSATIEIRKDPQFIHLPIVAMTANAMPQDKENCKNAGMNDYISKPIDPEELFRALLKWIRPTLKEELKELKNDFSISDSSFINELPIIDGLDTQLGMLRVLGKKTLYVNMLKNYVRGQESVPAALFDALNNNDFEAAKRLAHTAKSVSGNIGAMPLHHIAAHIESMITEQVSLEEINEALVHFEILQTQMIQALTSVLLTPQQEEMTQHWEAQHIESAVNDLNTLLKDDDMAALTFLNEHSALLTLALGREAFTTLANLVRNVDFEQASEFLEQIKQNH
jgi:two-component system sensor histidine kinase/response regulator